VVQPDGSRLSRTATETPVELGPDAVVDACISAVRTTRDSAPPEVRESIVGVGISSCGPVDPRAGGMRCVFHDAQTPFLRDGQAAGRLPGLRAFVLGKVTAGLSGNER